MVQEQTQENVKLSKNLTESKTIKIEKKPNKRRKGRQSTTKCYVCGGTFEKADEKNGNPWLGCDSCRAWAHYKCVGWGGKIGEDIKNVPFKCIKCK